MSPAVWSWIAAGVSILGLWISGYSPRWGWVYGIAAQGVWVTYGWVTDQDGMIALSVAFLVVYGRNLRRWRGTKFEPAVKRQPRVAPRPCDEEGDCDERRAA